jgi:hypothetical protein
MQYDVKKLPLGKLTTAQIRAGYEALSRIEAAIKAPSSLFIPCKFLAHFFPTGEQVHARGHQRLLHAHSVRCWRCFAPQ